MAAKANGSFGEIGKPADRLQLAVQRRSQTSASLSQNRQQRSSAILEQRSSTSSDNVRLTIATKQTLLIELRRVLYRDALRLVVIYPQLRFVLRHQVGHALH